MVECTRCGECCKTNPCIFAQIKFGIDEWNGKPCPEFQMENGIAKCLWIEREQWMKDAFVGTGCEKPFHAKREGDKSFLDVLKTCLTNRELVKQFNRLTGCKLMEMSTRSPIVAMIDQATGYQDVLDEKESEYLQQFILFVYDCIWLRLPEKAFA